MKTSARDSGPPASADDVSPSFLRRSVGQADDRDVWKSRGEIDFDFGDC